MCSAAFPGLERQPFAKGTGELVSVPDKEFFKDRTLKKKNNKERKRVGGGRYLRMCEMGALSGVLWGDKELGWPISAQCGHTHCL